MGASPATGILRPRAPTLPGVSPSRIKVAILPNDLVVYDLLDCRSKDGCNAEATHSRPTRFVAEAM